MPYGNRDNENTFGKEREAYTAIDRPENYRAKLANAFVRTARSSLAVSEKIILAGGCGISPENPAQPGYGPFGACGMESPVPVINYNKKRLWT